MLLATSDDTGNVSLDQLIGRLFETIRHGVDTNAFDVLVQMDLTLTQLRTIALLGETDEPRPISDIADGLGVSLPTAGRAVDHLVHEELVERWEDPEDRRARLVELTPAGRGLVEVHRATISEHIRTFSDNLPDDIAAQLTEAISRALDAVPEPPGNTCGLTPRDVTAAGHLQHRAEADDAARVGESTTRNTP